MGQLNDPKRKRTKAFLVFTTVFFALCLLPDLFFLAFSPFVHDEPGTMRHQKVLLFKGIIFSYPVIYTVSLVVSWVLYSRQRYRPACIFALLPLINLIVFAFFAALADDFV